MNAVAAFLTVDWLLKEQQKASRPLARGFDSIDSWFAHFFWSFSDCLS